MYVQNNPELLDPVEYSDIRALTAQMQQMISSGTIDAPSWDLVKTSKLAARIYAPLGTGMSLGDHVRVVRTFVDAFRRPSDHDPESELPHAALQKDVKVSSRLIYGPHEPNRTHGFYKAYQDQLSKSGLKDNRIRHPLSRRTILTRMLIRITWASFLFTISLPGLLLWLPVVVVTVYAVHEFKKTGPIFDTYDEIAQYKLIYGLFSGLLVWFVGVLLTLPFAAVTGLLIPALMWMSLRWTEDAISALRSFMALSRLLWAGKSTFKQMYLKRADLHSRIMNLAVSLDLPPDPEAYFLQRGGKEKGRIRGKWDSSARYFSLRRRRKRDWNETLRLYDKVDFPPNEDM
jgi:glycerol-3-phosphate O-acyltransferase / dihydroxyacetone phosphate acyltransferase